MNPWENIAKPDPETLFNYTLADVDHPFEFFWARDAGGRYAIRFKGRYAVDKAQTIPSMYGVSTSLDQFDGFQYFNLTLDSFEETDIFNNLCESLMTATQNIDEENDAAAFDVILTRLKRWQDILKNKRQFLTVEQQIGLFGELLFLRDAFLNNLDSFDAVVAWFGPENDEQDFGFGDSLVEVKTARTTRDSVISIPSLAQLDDQSGEIYLVFQTVAVVDDKSPSSTTLNGLVREIKSRLNSNAAAIADFEMKLAQLPYSEIPEYEKVYLIPARRKIFRVNGEFPRIVPADVRRGVVNVKYTIAIEECVPFEADPDDVISRIMGGDGKAEVSEISLSMGQLLAMPEASDLEFKSSLRWSYQEAKLNRKLEQVVIKTVSAFGNTLGGRLVIGVDDDMNVLGLESDYSTLKAKNRDGFEILLFELLKNSFSTLFCTEHVRVRFEKYETKEVCVVEVDRYRPVQAVLKESKSGAKSEVFYVRTGNSTTELPVSELIEYNQFK